MITSAILSISINLAVITSPTVTYNALKKAEVNALNNPSQAINSYYQYLNHLPKLAAPVQLRWHTAAIRAALNSSQFSFAEDVFNNMKSSYDKAGNNKSGFYYNLAGIWFRKSGYYSKAELAYHCAFNTTDKVIEQIKYLNNAAVAARYTNKLALSKKYLQQASSLLNKTPHVAYEASINNSLGMLALNQNNYLLAKRKFSRSLYLKEGKSRATTQLISALNLLNSLLYLEDKILAEKVIETINKLMIHSNNMDHNIYYHWLKFSFAKLKNIKPEISEDILIKEYQLLSGSSYISLIEQRASHLNIPLPPHKKNIKKMQYTGPILHYLKSCDLSNVSKKS